MIELENISTLEMANQIVMVDGQARHIENMQELKTALQEDLHLERFKTWTYDNLYDRLHQTECQMRKANDKQLEPVIYPVRQYTHERITDPFKDDMYTYGEVLITNPLKHHSIEFQELNNLTIYEIKHLLSHTDAIGNNLLVNLTGMNRNRIEKLLDALQCYDEQVIRQYYETKELSIGTTVFARNRLAKQKIVEAQFEEIAWNLLRTVKEEFVWGRLDGNQIRTIKSVFLLDNWDPIRINLIKTIADYTTLSELKQGVTKTRALTRFIKK